MSTKIVCYRLGRADCSSDRFWGLTGGKRVGFHCVGSCHKWTTTPFSLQFLPRTLYVRRNETWIWCVLHLTTSQQIATSFSLVFPPTVDILPLCLDSVYWSFWFLFVFPGVGFFCLFVGWFCIVLWCHVWKLDFGLYCGRLCPLAACLCAHLRGSLHPCLRLRLSFYKNGAMITGPVSAKQDSWGTLYLRRFINIKYHHHNLKACYQ